MSAVAVPLQTQLMPSLPAQAVSPDKHDPFSFTMVYIRALEDNVSLLRGGY